MFLKHRGTEAQRHREVGEPEVGEPEGGELKGGELKGGEGCQAVGNPPGVKGNECGCRTISVGCEVRVAGELGSIL